MKKVLKGVLWAMLTTAVAVGIWIGLRTVREYTFCEGMVSQAVSAFVGVEIPESAFKNVVQTCIDQDWFETRLRLRVEG